MWYDIWHDIWHDIWYDIMWYDMIYDMIWYIWYDIYDIYLLTAIGLTPCDSSAVNIYTQTIHRTTQFTN
jgi:hypothetical protein